MQFVYPPTSLSLRGYLFKMLNPNTCVFRDFGRRGSQSQGLMMDGLAMAAGNAGLVSFCVMSAVSLWRMRVFVATFAAGGHWYRCVEATNDTSVITGRRACCRLSLPCEALLAETHAHPS